MGRPIRKTWFGPATLAGNQIVVNGVKWNDGTTTTNAYIVKQTGSDAYVVSNGTKSEIVFMVNANLVGLLQPSQCFILATPFGGSPLPCKKIAQYRVDLFAADGTVDSYSWSTIPATAIGQADLITTAPAGAILGITPGLAGYGYFAAPAVSFTGAGGSGAAATANVANGVVTGYNLISAGSGYATGAMTVAAPPSSAQATASATVNGSGTIINVVVLTGGGYYTTPPAITIQQTSTTPAVLQAVLTDGAVTSVNIIDGGLGYGAVIPEFPVPPAAVQATASATIA